METICFKIPAEKKLFRTDLPFSGRDAEGNLYTADGRSLLKNGRRFLPVMGEFHFSRFEPRLWREEILKMKAGGVTIIATYMFWIHHEERQGEWDFSGCRNIRAFSEICGECGMKLWLRVGPWAHGECRNGGFPDWIEGDSSFEKRVNDPKYLELVKIWFEKIYHEVQGLFVKDGGPILGLQLENEYGHCGGPEDKTLQEAHLRTLYRLARETGFIVPYYTATAWGGACTIDETLQVLSGYVDAPWDGGTDRLPPQDNFRFIPYFDDAETGSDFVRKDGSVSDEDEGALGEAPESGSDNSRGSGSTVRTDYPYLTAELGGGLQVTSHRRPVTSSKDNEAAILCALGSGAVLIGYYMYHGGINPEGRFSPLNESQASGGHTNTPVKSYDFDACINEAGIVQKSFGGLKKYALFLKTCGEDLAETEVILPKTGPETAADLHTIRAALRVNRRSGNAYLFVNQHQRLYALSDHPDTALRIELPDGTVRVFENLDFGAGRCFLYRFRLFDKAEELIPGNPLCMVGERRFYWIDGTEDSTAEGAEDFSRRKACIPADLQVSVLSESAANRAFLYDDGLYVTAYDDSVLIEDGGVKTLITMREEERLTVYRPDGSIREKRFRAERMPIEKRFAETDVRMVSEERNTDGKILFRDYLVHMDYTGTEEAHRLFLSVDFLGDRTEVYEAFKTAEGGKECPGLRDAPGKLLDDWFTTGKPWNILLDRFGRPDRLMIRVYDSDNTMPCTFSRDVYYDLPVEKGCEIREAKIQKSYRFLV